MHEPRIATEESMAPKVRPVRNVSTDKVDLRDRPYQPPVSIVPPPAFRAATKLPVLNQGQTSACTGFSLAIVVDHPDGSGVRHLLDRLGQRYRQLLVRKLLKTCAEQLDRYPTLRGPFSLAEVTERAADVTPAAIEVNRQHAQIDRRFSVSRC